MSGSSTIELRTPSQSGSQSHTEHDGEFISFNGNSNDSVTAPVDAQSALLPVSKLQQFTVLICAFFDVTVTIGVNQAYGVFLTQYLDSQHNATDRFLPPDQTTSRALLAFVGTLAAGLTWGGSIVVNPVMARTKDPRIITLAGAVLIGLGYVLASFSTKVWHLLLTQGLIYGLGSSLLYFPVLAVAPEYFDSHRGSAMGVILSGAGIGGLTYAPISRVLLAKIGTRWTLRALGIFNFAIALPIAAFTPQPRIRQKRPTLVNSKIAKKWTFILQAMAAMAQAAGNLVPILFISEFSTTLGYSVAFGAALLAINNSVNTVSRIMMGVIADVFGRQNTLVLATLGSAIVVLAFWMVSAETHSQNMWIIFVVTYGFFAGGYNSLFPTTIMEVCGRQAYASVNGFIYFVRGMGAMWGPPVAGALVAGSGTKSYTNLIWYDFALLMFSGICVASVRGLDAREKGNFKLKA